ncbi:MAG: DUF2059 domain-containing protein [Candidatus Hodarchaeota archaeon]
MCSYDWKHRINTKGENTSRSKKNEIIIAVIGSLGVLATAVFSNWDKTFPEKGEIRASYSGYRMTGDFETEFRYYVEVSGLRRTLESMQQHLADNLKIELKSEHPEHAEEIDAMMNAILEETRFDEIIRKLLPVLRKHFTIGEIQELNKFYSTEIMQNMIRKMPLFTQEAAPIQLELIQEMEERVNARFEETYLRVSKFFEFGTSIES